MHHMKSNMNFSYSVLQLFLYILVSFSSSAKSTPVLDADGHQLQAGTKYYIIPLQSGNGGGLALSAKDIPCPFYVMQEIVEASNGLPIRFLPVDNKQQFISLSSDMNIVFNAATICVQSTVWKLEEADENAPRQRYVMSNGVVGHPGVDTVNSWFKIEKYGNGNGYRIIFCPSVCSSCKVMCGNLGVLSENGKKWLGLVDEPLVITFKKA